MALCPLGLLCLYVKRPGCLYNKHILIIVDPHPQEDIKAFSVVVLTFEPGSRAHYCFQFQKAHQHLQSITLAVVVVWISF